MQDLERTIISQYANSPTINRLIANMNAYIDPSADIDKWYNQVWNVDTAVGWGLDVWGRIVGVGRVLNIGSTEYLGLENPSSTGASGVPFRQGPFYHGESLTTNFSLLDGPYRGLILAKALANITDSTVPSINQILINLFGAGGPFELAGNSYVEDLGGMEMAYVFSSTLDPVQTAIIFQSGVLPRPAGVLSSVVSP